MDIMTTSRLARLQSVIDSRSHRAADDDVIRTFRRIAEAELVKREETYEKVAYKLRHLRRLLTNASVSPRRVSPKRKKAYV